MSSVLTPADADRPSPDASAMPRLTDLLECIGNVPLHRILRAPAVGTATVADWERAIDAGYHCEWIAQTLVEKPMGWMQGSLAAILLGYFWEATDRCRLGLLNGEQGFIKLPNGRRRSPDAAYYSRGRLPEGKMPRVKVPQIVPDIAIEVLSDGNTVAEMQIKRRDFFDAGVHWFWIVEPELRRIDVYCDVETFQTHRDGDRLTAPDLLPELSIDVTELFDRLT